MAQGTVLARGGLNLRKSPKTGAVVKSLRRGSAVEILGEETWLRVRTRDGQAGFVLGDFIERDAASAIASPATAASGPSMVCDIAVFQGSQFIGEQIRADRDFWPSLERINGFAKTRGVQVHVTSSAREPDRKVSGAIVKPATRSNHLVGHAIDMNLKSASGFFNSKKLKKANLSNLPQEIKGFLNDIRGDPDLRWGGDFGAEDPVHIDDNLNNSDSARWDAKLASLA